MPTLVPELLVSDLNASLKFWCGLIGFEIAYQRPEEKFAYLALGDAEVMLEQQIEGGRYWITGELAPPLGRGINFQIKVSSIDLPLDRLAESQWPLHTETEDKWYRSNEKLLGNRQFLVQDPDGYLLRLFEFLGERIAA